MNGAALRTSKGQQAHFRSRDGADTFSYFSADILLNSSSSMVQAQ